MHLVSSVWTVPNFNEVVLFLLFMYCTFLPLFFNWMPDKSWNVVLKSFGYTTGSDSLGFERQSEDHSFSWAPLAVIGAKLESECSSHQRKGSEVSSVGVWRSSPLNLLVHLWGSATSKIVFLLRLSFISGKGWEIQDSALEPWASWSTWGLLSVGIRGSTVISLLPNS